MKLVSNTIRLSVTDLANYLGCKHLTQLDRAVALGELITALPKNFTLNLLNIVRYAGGGSVVTVNVMPTIIFP